VSSNQRNGFAKRENKSDQWVNEWRQEASGAEVGYKRKQRKSGSPADEKKAVSTVNEAVHRTEQAALLGSRIASSLRHFSFTSSNPLRKPVPRLKPPKALLKELK